MRKEAVSKERFPRTTDTYEENNEFIGGFGQKVGDSVGIRKKFFSWDLRILNPVNSDELGEGY